ncbi:DUF3598 family protein [Sporosarcina sp. E16_3]|nr:DUF3598 family protein [Sporosarcina sp. E16_3]
MMGIREEMPVFARHEGEWKGVYTVVDPKGNVIDQHDSYLTCNLREDDKEYPYFQTNTYTWADGRSEKISFPGSYKDKHIIFDTDRINGHSWEIDENTIVLTWKYVSEPNNYLYEMINLSPDGKHRARVWQWFENGELTKRTIIKEEKVL